MKVYTTNSLIGSTKQSLGSNACLCVLGMQCVRAHLPLAGCHAQGHAGHEIGVLPTRETPGHNQALCRPMQRQARQAEVVCRALHNVPVTLPRQSWNNWCKQLAVVDCAPNRADLHVLRQARKVRAIARQASAGAQSQASSQSSRQNKSAAPPLPKSAPTRRTPFRLRNVRPVIRPGSKSKKIDASSRNCLKAIHVDLLKSSVLYASIYAFIHTGRGSHHQKTVIMQRHAFREHQKGEWFPICLGYACFLLAVMCVR